MTHRTRSQSRSSAADAAFTFLTDEFSFLKEKFSRVPPGGIKYDHAGYLPFANSSTTLSQSKSPPYDATIRSKHRARRKHQRTQSVDTINLPPPSLSSVVSAPVPQPKNKKKKRSQTPVQSIAHASNTSPIALFDSQTNETAMLYGFSALHECVESDDVGCAVASDSNVHADDNDNDDDAKQPDPEQKHKQQLQNSGLVVRRSVPPAKMEKTKKKPKLTRSRTMTDSHLLIRRKPPSNKTGDGVSKTDKRKARKQQPKEQNDAERLFVARRKRKRSDDELTDNRLMINKSTSDKKKKKERKLTDSHLLVSRGKGQKQKSKNNNFNKKKKFGDENMRIVKNAENRKLDGENLMIVKPSNKDENENKSEEEWSDSNLAIGVVKANTENESDNDDDDELSDARQVIVARGDQEKGDPFTDGNLLLSKPATTSDENDSLSLADETFAVEEDIILSSAEDEKCSASHAHITRNPSTSEMQDEKQDMRDERNDRGSNTVDDNDDDEPGASHLHICAPQETAHKNIEHVATDMQSDEQQQALQSDSNKKDMFDAQNLMISKLAAENKEETRDELCDANLAIVKKADSPSPLQYESQSANLVDAKVSQCTESEFGAQHTEIHQDAEKEARDAFEASHLMVSAMEQSEEGMANNESEKMFIEEKEGMGAARWQHESLKEEVMRENSEKDAFESEQMMVTAMNQKSKEVDDATLTQERMTIVKRLQNEQSKHRLQSNATEMEQTQNVNENGWRWPFDLSGLSLNLKWATVQYDSIEYDEEGNCTMTIHGQKVRLPTNKVVKSADK